MGLGATSKMGSIHFVFTTQSKRPLGNRDLDLTITHCDVPRKAASENAPLGGPSLRSTSGTVYLFHLPSPRSCILHAHVTEGFSFEIFLNSSLCLPRPITLIQLTSHKWLLWPAPNRVIFFPFVRPLSSLAPNSSVRLDSVSVPSQTPSQLPNADRDHRPCFPAAVAPIQSPSSAAAATATTGPRAGPACSFALPVLGTHRLWLPQSLLPISWPNPEARAWDHLLEQTGTQGVKRQERAGD